MDTTVNSTPAFYGYANSTADLYHDDAVSDNIVWQDDWVVSEYDHIHISLTRLAGGASILSASCIVLETTGDIWANSASTLTRILLAMEVCQLFAGIGWTIGPWLAPSFIPDAWGAQGTFFYMRDDRLPSLVWQPCNDAL